MRMLNIHTGRLFMATALVMLAGGLLLGVLSSQVYIFPQLFRESIGFSALRPMHVTSVMFWILMGATGAVYSALEKITGKKPGITAVFQWLLWIVAGAGIYYSYFTGKFGGREYWEFDPVWALPLAAAWLLFIVNFFRMVKGYRKWPVYMWMWMTGVVFFFFTFIENYLWLLPYFRDHFVTDMTIQWKVNGSLVGSWNQLLYGTAFFLMDRIRNDSSTGNSRLAFGMYFLGLFNLMFNWGHHIYTLPTENYVRYIAYGVSMTEWIIFARIVYTWKSAVTEAQKYLHRYPYLFLLAADVWVFINLGQGLLMSIPALNIYTHGTHVTVAHAMGTTIGINTMIMLAACFEFFKGNCESAGWKPRLNKLFWMAQGSLLIFFLALNVAGIGKGIWQMSDRQVPFRNMMMQLQPAFYLFVFAGILLMLALGGLCFALLKRYFMCDWKTENTGTKIIKLKNHEQAIDIAGKHERKRA